MTVTITRTPALSSPILPDLTERASYTAAVESRNQIHAIVGRADPEATLRPAGLRVGTFSLLFRSRAAAFSALSAHSAVGLFRLMDSVVTDASMYYVVGVGSMGLTLQDDLKTWQLTVPFQEVLP